MKVILDQIARHKAGRPVGLYSVCSAHPLVIEATFRQANLAKAPFVVIEATSNQVNQDGGYTGMTPDMFRDFVFAIAEKTGFARDRIVLGGDHLGPNVWTGLPSDEAMSRSEVLIDAYVRAGFRKIHLDCSMSCADDPVPLPELTVAQRAARLCVVAEKAAGETGGEAPVYVVGTEVPVPGGAAEDLETLAVTTADASLATLAIHRELFPADVWPRVIATVVQPGVEFDHTKVVDYVSSAAQSLSRSIEAEPHCVFEAHSTDYQTDQALRDLVMDHFAILKVGPGVTFALREALWALDAVEREMLGEAASGFRDKVMAVMRAEPRYWEKYYHSTGTQLDLDLQYSLSDRIRYYWPHPAVAAAQEAMFANLIRQPPSLPLLSQYLPHSFTAVRERRIRNVPADLVVAHVMVTLNSYSRATGLGDMRHA